MNNGRIVGSGNAARLSEKIRLARRRDVPLLPAIEYAAGQLFREVGMAEIADDDPPTDDIYLEALTANLLWVAEQNGIVIGYGFSSLLDDVILLEQVSLNPDYAGAGVGAALLDTMTRWAHSVGIDRSVLTTFRDVPWNAPYYRRIGFEELSEQHLGPKVAEVLAQERATDLGRWTRIAMTRPTTYRAGA